MNRLMRDTAVLLIVMIASIAGATLWLQAEDGPPVAMQPVLQLDPVVSGEGVVGFAEIENLTNEEIRCIGCSMKCSFGCAGPQGIPFAIPAGEKRSLSVKYDSPPNSRTDVRSGEIELDVFFDHIRCRELKLKVKYTVLPPPAGPNEPAAPAAA